MLVEIAESKGLPKGVLNVVNGWAKTPEKDSRRSANDTDFGPAAYVWTDEPEAAMMWMNSKNIPHLSTPFGGKILRRDWSE